MAGNENSGRPPKPAIVHLLNGNPSKLDRQRLMREHAEPLLPVEAPPMPDWLDDDARQEWARVVPDLVKLRLISKMDMQVMAQYCEAVSDYRRWTLKIQQLNEGLANSTRGDVQTYKTGAQDLSIWRKLRNDAERRANDAGAKFGFSPMARRSLKPAVPQGELFPNDEQEIAQKYF
ncbi:phage terminase small subunit P27 family [Pseudomonas sp. GW531-T4]|uniref:phage terminase small subunit P27 family n=1 Tax=Pseudomonas sp. GW531-T4 TaxID=2075553 RepID=UPI000CD1EB81|nr:phage terminase small subunit P27 family [Pseudomonas sp. GW531-T4]POA75362.1 phage terminase small subunit P27 family [Pseudomonas sp. GW531-T4]